MSTTTDYSHGEPAPVRNDGPSIHDKVIAYFESHYLEEEAAMLAGIVQERKELGLKKYETILQAHNGRDWLVDFIEEVADALMYAQQGLDECAPGSDSRFGTASLYNSVRHLLVEAARFRRNRDAEVFNA